MDFAPKEIEQMAAGLNRFAAEPPVTPDEQEDDLLTLVRRIVKTANGNMDQFEARYGHDCLEIIYGNRVFARCGKEPGHEEWIEFRMYPALRDKYAPDPRFQHVPDKNAEYWRIELSRPQDVQKFSDLIVDETI